MRDQVYLDYAATSAIRPEPVVEAVARYLRDIGATPGRSGHAPAVEAGRVVLRCRMALAELFGISGDPGRIVFQLNATHALNTALLGTLEAGERVVRTRYDHNAVRRPAAALRARGVEEVVLGARLDGSIDMGELDRALSSAGRSAKLVALPHVSNVLGCELPVREIADRARAAGALVLLDAAQSAGHLPVRVEELGVDMLAFTGHKGLLGPQGIGGLWIRDGIHVAPLVHGGTGGDSAEIGMPDALPDRLEAGTQNGPGIAGLLAGIQWILERGLEAIGREEGRLRDQLVSGLQPVPGLRILSPTAEGGVGIVTLTMDGIEAAELSHRLEREHGILVRGGLHCAPEAHQLLGTEECGAVRLSIGWATTEEDIRRAVSALTTIAGDIGR